MENYLPSIDSMEIAHIRRINSVNPVTSHQVPTLAIFILGTYMYV
jgi:hypothetical protein